MKITNESELGEDFFVSMLGRLRAETPGVAERIHLNNAGAALMPTPVRAAIREHLDLEMRFGGYEAADLAAATLRDTWDALADLLGARPHQIAVTEHATHSFVQALSSIPLQRGDVLLTSIQDYNSNQIQYLSLAERFGVRLEYAPVDAHGALDPAATSDRIHRLRPRAVALTQIPTNSGLVQPLEGIGAATRAVDGWFLVDACQSVGQIPVDVGELECDFLSGTGRKFLRGPRGTGFLYVSERALDAGLLPLFPDLRGVDWIADGLTQPATDARRFESWEYAWALVAGLGAAVRYALEVGIEAGSDRALALAAHLRARLEELHHLRVLDRGERLGAIVTVSVEGVDERELMLQLRDRGVNASHLDKVSAVLDFERKGVTQALRLSPHYYNTEEEIERAVEILQSLPSAPADS